MSQTTRYQSSMVYIRAMTTYVWSMLSIGLYSIPCIFLSFFSRKAAYAIGKLWCKHILLVGGVKLVVRGLGNIDPQKKYTFLSNHQSQMDIMSLMLATPQRLAFIAKKELFQTLFFGWGISALGMIPIDRRSARHARDSFTLAAKRVREESFSLLVFPEGTRSADGTLQPFKQGSFTLVLEAGLETVPVAIHGGHRILPKGAKGVLSGTIIVEFGKPFNPKTYSSQQKKEIAQSVYEQIHEMVQKQEKQFGKR